MKTLKIVSEKCEDIFVISNIARVCYNKNYGTRDHNFYDLMTVTTTAGCFNFRSYEVENLENVYHSIVNSIEENNEHN